MQVNLFKAKAQAVTDKTGAIQIIAEFLADNSAERIGLIESDADGYITIKNSGDADKAESNRLQAVAGVARKWGIPFDPELYSATITQIGMADDGAWNSSSIGC